ncbi:hypothetical protein Acsp05_33580 [Actinokineospora sp. NBRC 105648]|nr:hypothetical protein Acsp05_33580 [Actinokineospora sp. NBRC 105648]
MSGGCARRPIDLWGQRNYSPIDLRGGCTYGPADLRGGCTYRSIEWGLSGSRHRCRHCLGSGHGRNAVGGCLRGCHHSPRGDRRGRWRLALDRGEPDGLRHGNGRRVRDGTGRGQLRRRVRHGVDLVTSP